MVTNTKAIQSLKLGDLIDLLELKIMHREQNLSKYQQKPNPSQFFVNTELELIQDLKSILEGFSMLKHLNIWVKAEEAMNACEKSDPSLSCHSIVIHLNSRSKKRSFIDLYIDDYV